jgi:hypothetical protein
MINEAKRELIEKKATLSVYIHSLFFRQPLSIFCARIAYVQGRAQTHTHIHRDSLCSQKPQKRKGCVRDTSRGVVATQQQQKNGKINIIVNI